MSKLKDGTRLQTYDEVLHRMSELHFGDFNMTSDDGINPFQRFKSLYTLASYMGASEEIAVGCGLCGYGFHSPAKIFVEPKEQPNEITLSIINTRMLMQHDHSQMYLRYFDSRKHARFYMLCTCIYNHLVNTYVNKYPTSLSAHGFALDLYTRVSTHQATTKETYTTAEKKACKTLGKLIELGLGRTVAGQQLANIVL